jgi:hypothetical protein
MRRRLQEVAQGDGCGIGVLAYDDLQLPRGPFVADRTPFQLHDIDDRHGCNLRQRCNAQTGGHNRTPPGYIKFQSDRK